MIKGFLKFAYTEFKILLREPEAVFFTLIFPFFFLLLTMEVFVPEGVDIIDEVVPALMVLVIASTAIYNLPFVIITYRQIRFLRRLKASPVSPATVLGSVGISNFILNIIGILLLALGGIFIYEAEFEGEILIFLLGFIISFFSLASFFLWIPAVTRSEKAASAIGTVVYLPVMFFSGIFVPLEVLPDWIAEYIAPFMPTTYAVKLLQGLWVGEPFLNFSSEIIFLTASLIIGLAVSAMTFRWE